MNLQHAGYAPDVGNEEPGFGTYDGSLPVFCHSAASSKPCEGLLDHPPSGDDLEALRSVGALDDLQCPASDLFQCTPQLVPGVTSVREDMAQQWIGYRNGLKGTSINCPIPPRTAVW